MFAKDLETAISEAYRRAHGRRHASMGVEHLLLALLDEPKAREELTACGADLEVLRGDLVDIIELAAALLPPGDRHDTRPTLAFQRVLQRSVYYVQSNGLDEVTGATALVSLFGEKGSRAVRLLAEHGVSRAAILNRLRLEIPAATVRDVADRTGWREQIENRVAELEARLNRIEKKLGG